MRIKAIQVPHVLAMTSIILNDRYDVNPCKHSIKKPQVDVKSKMIPYAFKLFFLGISNHIINARIAYKRQCSYLSTLGVLLMLIIEFSMVG